MTVQARRFGRPAAVGAGIVLGAIVVWWCWRALHDPGGYDSDYAYLAGQQAWLTGHPEHVTSWDGAPLLAASMALVSRVLSAHTVADLVAITGAGAWLAAVAFLMRGLRSQLAPWAWWVLTAALLTFGPLMSTVWTKQFNSLSLVLGVLGFECLRRRRVGVGALAIGLSVALKPLLVLLPFVLVVRRETRRAGLMALAWIAGLSLASLALFAVRAGDVAQLNPVHALTNFQSRSVVGVFTCAPWNYSPTATICRLTNYWPAVLHAVQRTSLPVTYAHGELDRAIVIALVLALGLWSASALRGHRATSWELFAVVCPLSAMLSPLAWSHYQILLAPLFVLVFVRFARDGAGPGSWTALVAAFVLASLAWSPYGSIVTDLGRVFSVAPRREPALVDALAQFAQYVLLLAALWWYGTRAARSSAVPAPPVPTK